MADSLCYRSFFRCKEINQSNQPIKSINQSNQSTKSVNQSNQSTNQINQPNQSTNQINQPIKSINQSNQRARLPVSLQRCHPLPVNACGHEGIIFPSHPGSHLTIFYRDASSPLLQLINPSQSLHYYILTFSRSPLPYYGSHNTSSGVDKNQAHDFRTILAGVPQKWLPTRPTKVSYHTAYSYISTASVLFRERVIAAKGMDGHRVKSTHDTDGDNPDRFARCWTAS